MTMLAQVRPKSKNRVSVLHDFDVAADAKRRISLRGSKTKYFHVTALANGAYLLEPRVLVPLRAVSPRALRTLEKSVARLKQGLASPPVDIDKYLEK
jgi:hypothetical protein